MGLILFYFSLNITSIICGLNTNCLITIKAILILAIVYTRRKVIKWNLLYLAIVTFIT